MSRKEVLEDGLLSDDLTHNPLEVVSDEVPHNEFAAEGSGEEHAVADPSKAAKCKEKCNPCNVIPGPPCVRNIILNELCERYSFYGLRAILTLYMIDGLHIGKDTAISLFSLFNSAAYFTPILGGIIADSFLGKFKTILIFSCVYAAGSLTLSLTAFPAWGWGAIVGLGAIAIGTEQFSADSKSEVTRYFLLFYFVINVGSTVTYFTTPLLREHAGFGPAFGSATILLIISIIIFLLARKSYKHNPPQGSVFVQFTKVSCAACRNKCRERREGNARRKHWLDYARGTPKFSDELVSSVKAVWAVLPILLMLPLFWTLFDQQGSSWTTQARQMDGSLGNFVIQPDQIALLNPFFVLVLIPIFNKFIYPCLGSCSRRRGMGWANPKPLRRMSVGMLLGAFAFALSAWVQAKVDDAPPHSVSMLWQMPQYFVITTGEILLSTTGLEFSYSQAPSNMKGTLIALFYLANAIGDLLTAAVYSAFGFLTDPQRFLVFAGLMIVNLLVFLPLAYCYTPVMELERLAAANRGEDDEGVELTRDGEEGRSPTEDAPLVKDIRRSPAQYTTYASAATEVPPMDETI